MNISRKSIFILAILAGHLSVVNAGIECSRWLHYLFTDTADESGYDIKYYHIDLAASDTTIYLSGNVMMKAKGTRQLEKIVLELTSSLNVDSVQVNGSTTTFLHQDDTLTLLLNQNISPGEYFTARVYYKGFPPGSGFFSGITSEYVSKYDVHATWTLSEPFNAKSWFPCKQYLPDKIDSTDIWITVDSELKAGSNGLLKNITVMPDGRHRYEWKTKYPMAYYLISMAISDYQDYSFNVFLEEVDDSLLVQNYIYDHEGILEELKDDIDKTGPMIQLFSELYGVYPFHEEKYGHCMAPMGGGMEHQTMTTLETFRFDLVAHELAHMWFGDNVTCATWHDIWVNEGFASYSEFLAREFLRDVENARDWMYYAHRAALASPNGSIYVPRAFVDNPIRIFNYQLSYKKGAAILHTLRFVLHDDPLFFSIMKEFQQAYADSVATADDFIDIVETLSGEDYTYFFEQWFYGEGYPVFDVAWSYYNDTLTIISEQTTSSNATPFFQLPVEYRVQTASGDSIIRLMQDETSEVYYLHFSNGVTGIEFDPNNWLLNEVTIQQIAGFRDSTIYMLIKPNPANEKLEIEFREDKKEREITITDTRGKIIKKLVSRDRTVNLNIHHWANGFYLVNVDDGENSYTGKIIKSSTN